MLTYKSMLEWKCCGLVIVELLQKRFKKLVVGSENDACKCSVGTFMFDRCVVRRRKRLTYQDALGGVVSLLTAEKRTCQSSAETRILHNLLTSLCFRLS